MQACAGGAVGPPRSINGRAAQAHLWVGGSEELQGPVGKPPGVVRAPHGRPQEGRPSRPPAPGRRGRTAVLQGCAELRRQAAGPLVRERPGRPGRADRLHAIAVDGLHAARQDLPRSAATWQPDWTQEPARGGPRTCTGACRACSCTLCLPAGPRSCQHGASLARTGQRCRGRAYGDAREAPIRLRVQLLHLGQAADAAEQAGQAGPQACGVRQRHLRIVGAADCEPSAHRRGSPTRARRTTTSRRLCGPGLIRSEVIWRAWAPEGASCSCMGSWAPGRAPPLRCSCLSHSAAPAAALRHTRARAFEQEQRQAAGGAVGQQAQAGAVHGGAAIPCARRPERAWPPTPGSAARPAWLPTSQVAVLGRQGGPGRTALAHWGPIGIAACCARPQLPCAALCCAQVRAGYAGCRSDSNCASPVHESGDLPALLRRPEQVCPHLVASRSRLLFPDARLLALISSLCTCFCCGSREPSRSWSRLRRGHLGRAEDAVADERLGRGGRASLQQ